MREPSAFNVLYWQGEPKIIDFPQAVDPRLNDNARSLFEWDVTNLSRSFGRYGVAVDPHVLVDKLWARYASGELWLGPLEPLQPLESAEE